MPHSIARSSDSSACRTSRRWSRKQSPWLVPPTRRCQLRDREGPSAQLGGGIGYSESQSFILSGNYADANFLGTGRRVSVDLNSGPLQQGYGISVTEPYFTAEHVGLTGNVTYRDQTQFVSAVV
jgi:outer membrane protein assembly factor BamA